MRKLEKLEFMFKSWELIQQRTCLWFSPSPLVSVSIPATDVADYVPSGLVRANQSHAVVPKLTPRLLKTHGSQRRWRGHRPMSNNNISYRTDKTFEFIIAIDAFKLPVQIIVHHPTQTKKWENVCFWRKQWLHYLKIYNSNTMTMHTRVIFQKKSRVVSF
jgi:hypothetical protein